MAIQITVVSGKQDEKKAPAGLMRTLGTEKEDTHGEVSLAELVSNLLAEVATGVTAETEVEVELSGIIELNKKAGAVAATFDVGSESPGARTLKLKFKSTVKPR
jgi:hypothetical protein